MTKLLEKALEAVRRLPAESQDEIARTVLHLVSTDQEPEAVDPEHLPAILQGLEQAKTGQLATEAEVEAAFRRFDR
jgi:predicted transcriptional regulator